MTKMAGSWLHACFAVCIKNLEIILELDTVISSDVS